MADTFLSPLEDYAAVATFCGVSDANRADFRRAVDAAARAVRGKCGPVLLETGLTHTTRRACHDLVMPFRVAKLTSLTSSTGTVLMTSDYYAEPHHLGSHGGQIVRHVDGHPIPACTVVYESGWEYDALPEELIGAGYELARHLWRTQLGNQRTGDENGSAWLWPRQAEGLAADWLLAPLGIA